MNALTSLFRLATLLSLTGWGIVALFPLVPEAPRAWVLTLVWVGLALIYLYLLVLGKRHDAPGEAPRGGFATLRGVISLFKTPRVVLAGWIHFLAFDLFVGAAIATDAARVGITHWWLLPSLGLTLMYGPAGLLSYIVLRLFLV